MHRVTNKFVQRVEDGERVRYEEGERFEPTEDELRAFGDRLEPVESEPEVEVLTVDEVLEDAGIDPDDYDELREHASKYDDVDGSAKKEEIKKALAELLREG